MTDLSHLHVLEPAPGVLAFYDGRVPGYRFSDARNWVDSGALSVGIASYAVVSGDQALVYDTHVSVAHGQAVRDALVARGVMKITVVLSHWHLDHVAGTAAFADCEVIANAKTAAHLTTRRAAIEAGTLNGPPGIAPLVLPGRVFSDHLALQIGAIRVELIEANIHSDDATVLWLPQLGLLLAGDTVEDCVTFVTAPQDFAAHLVDLDRLAELFPARVLPNHGAAEVIAAGGYAPEILTATQRYIRWLMAVTPATADVPMVEVIAGDLAAGILVYYPEYDAVHRENVARVLALRGADV